MAISSTSNRQLLGDVSNTDVHDLQTCWAIE